MTVNAAPGQCHPLELLAMIVEKDARTAVLVVILAIVPDCDWRRTQHAVERVSERGNDGKAGEDITGCVNGDFAFHDSCSSQRYCGSIQKGFWLTQADGNRPEWLSQWIVA